MREKWVRNHTHPRRLAVTHAVLKCSPVYVEKHRGGTHHRSTDIAPTSHGWNVERRENTTKTNPGLNSCNTITYFLKNKELRELFLVPGKNPQFVAEFEVLRRAYSHFERGP